MWLVLGSEVNSTSTTSLYPESFTPQYDFGRDLCTTKRKSVH